METFALFRAELRREDIAAHIAGNELVKEQLADFSKPLHLKALYAYAFEAKDSAEKLLRRMSYDVLKKRLSEERKNQLKS